MVRSAAEVGASISEGLVGICLRPCLATVLKSVDALHGLEQGCVGDVDGPKSDNKSVPNVRFSILRTRLLFL